jgi:peptidoglycan-N-acetylglucosamine deacetylase
VKKKYVFSGVLVIVCVVVGIIIYGNYKNKDVLEEFKQQLIDYDPSKEIKEATKSLDKNKKVEIISNVETDSNAVSLTFEGMTNKENIYKILELLKEYKVESTFFIPGIKAAEDTSIVENIKKANHEIGSGTLNSTKNMQDLSDKDLIKDFCYTNKILKTITNEDPILLKCTSTKYEDNVLQTAYASGNKKVVESDHYLSYQSFKNYDEARNYMKKISNGTIISIKLEGVLDDFEYGREELNEKPAIDKEAGLKEKDLEEKEEVTIVEIVEWILKATKEENKSIVKVSEISKLPKRNSFINNNGLSNFLPNKIRESNKNNDSGTITTKPQVVPEFEYADKIDFKKLITLNNCNLAPVVSQFYTTQEALTYTFRGISKEETLNNVLDELKKLNIKGTFFVTKNELREYPDRIEKIVKEGHEIGNGGITADSKLLNKSAEEICKEIYEVDVILRQKGINTKAYMAGYGYRDINIQEAVSTINRIDSLKGYELFTYSKAPITTKYKDSSGEDIVSDYFNIGSYMSLQKGEIVYFRLDSDVFSQENVNVIPNIIELLTNNYVKNGYAHKYNFSTGNYDIGVKPLGYSVLPLREIQNIYESESKLGRYNLLGQVKPLDKKTVEEAEIMMMSNYIGNKYVDISSFTKEEQEKIDREGTINTNGQSTIFLTFDDWGGDPIVGEILKVLDKHKVKASFFAISSFADPNSGRSNVNSNLLRTIALKGHDIGTHNYDHELLDSDKVILDSAIPKSYEALYNVIGDLDSLKPYFRAPELLVTRIGLLSVYESGFKYSISGNITTHDYEKSAEEVLDYVEEQLIPGKGNVLVMHMNNQSYYTPEAIDKLLTNNEKGVYGEVYKIEKLSNNLGY